MTLLYRTSKTSHLEPELRGNRLPLAIGHLCIGHPVQEDDTPALEREGWEHRHARAGAVIYR
jgi:hypothetical protein